LRVGQLQLGLDGPGQNAEDLPVDEVERIDRQQHRQHEGRAQGRVLCAGASGLLSIVSSVDMAVILCSPILRHNSEE
jgi:hypothetical protein